jgi:hypothetical protein
MKGMSSMPKNKVSLDVTLESDQHEWLSQMASKYGLFDESKALRVLLDFAMQDANEQDIFSSENIRCRHCT